MVLATDGLFQDLSSQEVVDYVGDFIAKRGTAQQITDNASTLLIEKALLRAGEKHAERFYRVASQAVGVAPSDEHVRAHLSYVITLPKDFKRKVHDDITVVVVFFNNSATTKPAVTPSVSTPAPATPALSPTLQWWQQHKAIAATQNVHAAPPNSMPPLPSKL